MATSFERHQRALVTALQHFFGASAIEVKPSCEYPEYYGTRILWRGGGQRTRFTLLELQSHLDARLACTASDNQHVAGFAVTGFHVEFDEDPMVLFLQWSCTDKRALADAVAIAPRPFWAPSTATTGIAVLPHRRGWFDRLRQAVQRYTGTGRATLPQAKAQRVAIQRRIHNEFGVALHKDVHAALRTLRTPSSHIPNLQLLLCAIRAFQGTRTPVRLKMHLSERHKVVGDNGSLLTLTVRLTGLNRVYMQDMQHLASLAEHQKIWGTPQVEVRSMPSRSLSLVLQVDLSVPVQTLDGVPLTFQPVPMQCAPPPPPASPPPVPPPPPPPSTAPGPVTLVLSSTPEQTASILRAFTTPTTATTVSPMAIRAV